MLALPFRLDEVVNRRVVYPIAVRFRGEQAVFSLTREMVAMGGWNVDRLRANTSRKLAGLLTYAHDNCPYYREAWPSAPGDRPDPFAFLARLPTIGKETLQLSAGELRSLAYHGRRNRKTTGGSTGQPVTIEKNPEAIAAEMAATWMGYGWVGVRLGDRGVRLWGSPLETRRRLRFLAADLAMNRKRFSAFAFTERDLAEYWRVCLRYRPRYLYGYVSMLVAFAEFLRARGYNGRGLGITAVITTSELLTEPDRSLLADVFGAAVQNEYGCGEVGPIAYSCPDGSLHLMIQNVVLEVVDERGSPLEAGEIGEIVVTDLSNQAMPLIRYRLGDLGVLGSGCRCPRPFPVLDRIIGRAYDFVVTPDGRRYHGEYFLYLFERLRDQGFPVAQFQVVQTASAEVRFDVVTSDLERVRRAIAEWAATALPRVAVRVNAVDRIQRAASGKMRVVINELGGPGETVPACEPSV